MKKLYRVALINEDESFDDDLFVVAEDMEGVIGLAQGYIVSLTDSAVSDTPIMVQEICLVAIEGSQHFKLLLLQKQNPTESQIQL